MMYFAISELEIIEPKLPYLIFEKFIVKLDWKKIIPIYRGLHVYTNDSQLI